MFKLQDLKHMRDGTNASEERLQMDRSQYLQGREGYPTAPEDGLTERDRGCYMMGYNVSEWEYARG